MSSGRFQDKVAIVTGGCKGIGRGCADIFAENGGKVAVWDVDDATGQTIPVSVKGGGELFYIHCDMTKEDDITNAVEKTIERFQHIDCLVNNAGWHPPHMRIDDFSADDFRKLLDLNLVGYFLASKFALPHLRKRKGSIVNISSGAGLVGQKESVTYCSTKGGVSAMARALAIDEAEDGVRVNTISPGVVNTPLLRTFVDPLSQQEHQRMQDFNLMRRWAEPKEIGRLCLFLATEATYMTGEDVQCSGGYTIGGGNKYSSDQPCNVALT